MVGSDEAITSRTRTKPSVFSTAPLPTTCPSNPDGTGTDTDASPNAPPAPVSVQEVNEVLGMNGNPRNSAAVRSGSAAARANQASRGRRKS